MPVIENRQENLPAIMHKPADEPAFVRRVLQSLMRAGFRLCKSSRHQEMSVVKLSRLAVRKSVSDAEMRVTIGILPIPIWHVKPSI